MSGASTVRRVSGRVTPLDVARHEALLAAWSALERARLALREASVDAAFEIAARVIGESARVDRGVVVAALGEALAPHGEAPAVLVRASAVDVAACEDALRGGPFAFEVMVDETVTPGGVVVESARGTIDARVSVRLARLRALLEGAA